MAIALMLAGIVTARGPVGPAVAESVLPVGTLSHFAIDEGSGLTASLRYPGVLWTHNDGGYQFLFAVSESGEYLAGFQVTGANLIDWEAIGSDHDGNLYLADIGSNGLARTHVAVHRVREPNPARRFGNVEVAQTWWLRFPGARPDCEAFFVHAGHGYLISRTRSADGQATLYRYPLTSQLNSTLLEEVARFRIGAGVTDASICPEGERLAMLTSEGAYVYQISGDPLSLGTASREFVPFQNDFVEGAALTDHGLFASAETRELWLFTNGAFRCSAPVGPTLRAAFAAGRLRLEFEAREGRRYSLEQTDPPGGFGWEPTGISFDADTDRTAVFEVALDGSMRFYRLRMLPGGTMP